MKQIASKVLKKVENIFKIKDSKISKKHMKLIVPAAVCLFVLVAVLGGKVIPSLTSSAYSITDLNGSLDNVKAGDIINYNINGYSDWKVLSVDKNNGTVEVTSNTNVKDLTIEPYKTVDEYNQLFQTEANKFLDNNYVVSARTISKADSLLIVDDNDEEYWLSNVNENTLMTNKSGVDEGSAIYTKKTFDLTEVYVIPTMYYKEPLSDYIPAVGSQVDLSVGGIDEWYYQGYHSGAGGADSRNDIEYYTFFSRPIKLQVNSVNDIRTVTRNLSESLGSSCNENPNCSSVYFDSSPSHDNMTLYEGKGFFDGIEGLMYFSGPSPYTYTRNQTYNISNSISLSEFNASDYDSINNFKEWRKNFYEPKTLTFGYRPVLTLKIGEGKSGKQITNNNIADSSLKVGDYVDYEANGYKSWRVLSVNKEAGTVDIISAGMVKNLSLYGMDDYENYEIIMQREVDAYKNGDNAVGARIIVNEDFNALSKLKDETSGFYWFNRKTQRRLDANYDLQTSIIENESSYDVGVLSSKAGSVIGYWVKLYSPEESMDNESKALGKGNYTFVAGLRPIITLQYDAVKPIVSQQTVNEVQNQATNYNNSFVEEQNTRNSGSKISIIGGSGYSGIGSAYIEGGTGSDYYDYDDIVGCDKNGNLKNVMLDIGKSNDLLRWIFILAFIYGVVFAGFVTYVAVRLLRDRYLKS